MHDINLNEIFNPKVINYKPNRGNKYPGLNVTIRNFHEKPNNPIALPV